LFCSGIGVIASKQAPHRRAQHAIEKCRPLQLALADAARVLVLFIFCSTPEALNHITHAPSKGSGTAKYMRNHHHRTPAQNMPTGPTMTI